MNEIITGDCQEVMRSIPDASVDAIITDPPYGISYQSARRTDKAQWKPKIANDEAPFVDWLPTAYRTLRDPGALVCFCRWDVQEEFRAKIERAGFTIKSQIIWDKVGHGMGDLGGEFAPRHEVAWFAVKGRFTFPGKRPTTVLRHARVPPADLSHPNEKPFGLMWDLVGSLTNRDGVVLDPFAGSGVVCQAAVARGRRYIGIEIDPAYAHAARERITRSQAQPRLLAI